MRFSLRLFIRKLAPSVDRAGARPGYASRKDKDFKPLSIPGLRTKESRQRYTLFVKRVYPTANMISLESNWSSLWPAPATFNPSFVPLSLRQGFSKNLAENSGVSPAKYGNLELMKIPNFLHASPQHIKLHCNAIKKFCTEWPTTIPRDSDQIANIFPVEVVTKDYVMCGPSIRDPRARIVELRVPLSALKDPSPRFRGKLLELLGEENFDRTREMIVLKSERCPLKKQNLQYLLYTLQVLVLESRKTYQWENQQKGISEKFVRNNIVTKQLRKTMESQFLEGNSEVERLLKEYDGSLERFRDDPADQQSQECLAAATLSLYGINTYGVQSLQIGWMSSPRCWSGVYCAEVAAAFDAVGIRQFDLMSIRK